MIEIILLYFLTKSIGATAVKKGEIPGRWKVFTVLAWIAFEILGLIFGIVFFGTKDIYSLMALALVTAFGGYLTIRYILDKKPDNKINEDIDSIGSGE
jgi:hypothetical protein